MSPSLAIKVGKWIAELCRLDEVKVTRLHFLGGEPTLSIDRVFAVLDTFETHKPSYTSPAGTKGNEGYVLFTNGDFLVTSTAMMNWLKERNVMIKMNPTTESLVTVERRIQDIKKVFGGAGLAVVLDDLNIERLPELTELAVKYKVHMRINRLYEGGIVLGYVDRYKQQMHKMFDILLASDWVMWPNFLVESTYVTWKGSKNPYPCGKCLVVIAANGSIRSCNADQDTTMGHIDTHTRLSDFGFKCRWSAKYLSECQGCKWITWCQGGCPYTRKITYGHYDKRTIFCEAFKELFPRLFELKDRWEYYQYVS